MSSLPIAVVVFLLGLVLIVVAVIGGGLEIKEIKIPTLSPISRALSALFGCILVAMGFFPTVLPDYNPPGPVPVTTVTPVTPSPLPKPAPAPPNPSPAPVSYQAIPIHYVENQKAFARLMRGYLESLGYAVNATEDDFSQIVPGNREPAGTVRVVYKSPAGATEQKVVSAIRNKFPDATNVVESLNNGASVDLQIELW